MFSLIFDSNDLHVHDFFELIINNNIMEIKEKDFIVDYFHNNGENPLSKSNKIQVMNHLGIRSKEEFDNLCENIVTKSRTVKHFNLDIDINKIIKTTEEFLLRSNIDDTIIKTLKNLFLYDYKKMKYDSCFLFMEKDEKIICKIKKIKNEKDNQYNYNIFSLQSLHIHDNYYTKYFK